MISRRDLRTIARGRLRDAQVLLRAKRFDGAFYLCGYAVELALKARICRTLGWPGFPESAQDFKGLQSVRTHDLEFLLRFSGVEARVKAKHLADWYAVLGWNPQKRYQAIGQSTGQEAAEMVTCVKSYWRFCDRSLRAPKRDARNCRSEG
jgi:HEPN domain-containing protein